MKPQITILFGLCLSLTLILSACAQAPQSVLEGWVQAMNAGDVGAALSYLAEDATLTTLPAFDGDGVYQGQAEIRQWYTRLVEAQGVTVLSGCQAQGETITCLDTYTDQGLAALGAGELESDLTAVVRDGKIQSYTIVARPASLAKFSQALQPGSPAPVEPAPAPLADGELQVASADALLGKWQATSSGYVVLHEFKPDGLLLVSVAGEGLISRTKYWFEQDVLYMEDTTGDCLDMPGTYQVYVTYLQQKPVQLRFVLLGEDACTTRKETLAGGALLPPGAQPAAAAGLPAITQVSQPAVAVASPAASQAALEQPVETQATQPQDLLGAWQGKFRGEAILIFFYEDGTFAVRWPESKRWIAHGLYAFENGELVIPENESCGGGAWRAFVTRRGEQSTRLRFELVRDDCEDRRTQFLEAPHVRVDM